MSYPNPDNEDNLAQEKEAHLNAQKEIFGEIEFNHLENLA